MTERLLVFTHDHDEDGWCSLCQKKTVRGVRIRYAETTGGVPQWSPSFDRETDRATLKGHDGYYRIGTCCIGNMVNALETRSE